MYERNKERTQSSTYIEAYITEFNEMGHIAPDV